MHIRYTMKNRTFSIDTKGFFFALQLFAVIALLAGVWQAWVPIRDYLAHTAEGATHSEGGIENTEVINDENTENAIERLLRRADSESGIFSGDTVARVFHYVPEKGRFVSIDLVAMEIALYEDGARKSVFPILYTPPIDAANALHEGDFTIGVGEGEQVSTLSMTRFPHYTPFGGRYAIHGEPTDTEGVAKVLGDSGSGIVLATADAEKLFVFVQEGTPLHVRMRAETPPYAPYTILVGDKSKVPATSAAAYAIADLARGQVVLEKNAGKARPIASITKLFTAVVASSAIGHGTQVQAPNGEYYTLGELFYPLLLRSDNAVAEAIAQKRGTRTFIGEMNRYVDELGMPTTSFADASGLSPQNISSAFDLTSFARHLYLDKRYVLDISREGSMSITSTGGTTWTMQNQNKLAGDPHFVGGKLGFTDEAGQTALSIFNVPIDCETRTVAIVVLGSSDWKQDTRTLLRWLLENVEIEG